MEWKLKSIDKETNHRFLNFYVLHYAVRREGKESDYPYFLASRKEMDDLLVSKKGALRPDGVLILAVTEEKDPAVLLIEEFRPALNRYILAVPAGLMDEGDKDETVTAYREAKEEAGVLLKDLRLLCPASPTSAGLSDELVAVVTGTIASKDTTHLEPFEDIRAKLYPIKDLPALLQDEKAFIALNVRLSLLYLYERHYGGKR